MANSEVSICNLALATLGADSIRDFSEDNKRARMCKNFYDATRDYLLAKFDWPFSRSFKNLNQLDLTGEDTPDGEYGYQLPIDCQTPRDVHPMGSSTPWRIVGQRLYTTLTAVGLYYTKTETNPAIFSNPFVNLLALGVAVRMCAPITQDKALAKVLFEQYQVEMGEVWESEANVGNEYRMFDENPENDSFVTGEALGNPPYTDTGIPNE
jgi:hypothetical protein